MKPHAKGSQRWKNLAGALTGGVAGELMRTAVQAIGFIILARALGADAVGLYAVGIVIFGFAGLLRDFGTVHAAVQADTLTPRQKNALFWVNVALGGVITSAIILCAPLIASAVSRPELSTLLQFSACSFLATGVSVQFIADCRRNQKHHRVAASRVLATLLATITGIAIAWRVPTPYALFQIPVSTGVWTVVFMLFATKWRPGPPWQVARLGSVATVARNVTVNKFLNYCNRNVDRTALAAVANMATLGTYQLAYRFLLVPIRDINGPIANVVLPHLCRVAVDPPRFASDYLKIVRGLTILTTPVIGIALVISRPTVELLLGEEWMFATVYIYALGPAALVGIMNIYPGWIFVACGRTETAIRLSFLGLLLTAALVGAALPFGGFAIAGAVSISEVIRRVGALFYVRQFTEISREQLVAALAPSYAACSVALVTGFLTITLLNGYPLASIVGATMVFLSSYGLILAATRRGRTAISEINGLVSLLAPSRATSK